VKKRHAAIIGGGVIGTSCAYFLARSGWDVTILDAAKPGQACSRGNCGLVCPSHVLPLNAPGAIRKTLAAMLRPNSPFSIRPRLDPKLWVWLAKFALRCGPRASERSARGLASLLASSNELYQQLISDEGIECEWQQVGSLFVYLDRHHFDQYEATDRMLRRDFGIGAEKMDRASLCEFEPALRDDVAGGWFYPQDSHLRPDRLVAAWLKTVRRHGGKIVEDCQVTGFSGGDGLATAETNRGEVAADVFVVAAGAVSPFFNRHLGCNLPIQPGKGYSITMPRPATCPRRPLLMQDHKVVVTPMQTGYRIGSTMEFAGYDQSINPKRLQILRDAARLYLTEPEGERIEQQWYGWRSMTYDGCPIIDRSPAWRNVWIASGHNMLGLTLAPVTGKLIAELANGRPPHLDVRPYALNRF
jgi:D-amino-acid dehydrogenase